MEKRSQRMVRGGIGQETVLGNRLWNELRSQERELGPGQT